MSVDDIIAEIKRAKKYSSVDINALSRICADFIPRYAKSGDVVKAVKKELHIIYGSFLTSKCHKQAQSLIADYPGDDIYADGNFAAQLLALHVSTLERAGQAAEIYGFAGGFIKPGDALADIGCGFNPFALPLFMNRPKSYAAYDICSRTVDLINLYFNNRAQAAVSGPNERLQGAVVNAGDGAGDGAKRDGIGSAGIGANAEPRSHYAKVLDAVAQTPDCKADVVFMFKLFPLLEQQKKGRGFELLREMRFRDALISFPTKSASGRDRGMADFYTKMFTNGLPEGLTITSRTVFDNELFFAIKKLK